MCGLGGGGYDPPPLPPQAPMAPEAPDASRQEKIAKDPDDERRRRLAAGQQGTVLTGNRGIMDDGSSRKTVLGG